jgi:hypothetical protein
MQSNLILKAGLCLSVGLSRIDLGISDLINNGVWRNLHRFLIAIIANTLDLGKRHTMFPSHLKYMGSSNLDLRGTQG